MSTWAQATVCSLQNIRFRRRLQQAGNTSRMFGSLTPTSGHFSPGTVRRSPSSRLLGLPLIALGAVVAAESLRQWYANQRAMRRGDPLPRSRMPYVLTVGVVVVAAIAVALAAAGTS